MGKTALIVAGGRAPGKALLYRYMMKSDMIIGADSGAACLVDDSIETFAVVGDLDSIDQESLKWFADKKTKIVKANDIKDETDTMLAIIFAVENGADKIYILGALGKRLDHQFANVALLMYADKLGVEAFIVDEHNFAQLAKPEMQFEASLGDYFSVFSLSKRTELISSSGLKYPLDGLVLRRDTPIGVSNEAVSKNITIRVKKGKALIVHSYE